jgi:capsular exopolysaccharide synthesis family protein
VTFRDYLRVARERRVLIVLLTLLFATSAYVFAANQTPVYTAEVSIQFESTNTQTSLFGATVDPGGETPEQRAAANAATLTRPAILDKARQLLGKQAPKEDLSTLVDAQPEARTQLVIVRATGSSGRQAARVANAVARATVLVTRKEARQHFAEAATAQRRVLKALPTGPGSDFFRLQQLDAAARFEELARVASPATIRRSALVPRTATSPHIVRTTILGALIGLTLGLVAAFVRDSLDRRFRTAREIAEDLKVPLLGSVPEGLLGGVPLKRKGTKRLSGRDLETFRIIRNNIEFLGEDPPPKVIVVTSALPEEGKSTVSTALATAFAIAGKRTLLVECDLRRPTLARRLGIHPGPGLTDYLGGDTAPADVLQIVDVSEGSDNGSTPQGAAFAAIVAGPPAAHAVEVLRSKRCFDFFEQVREVYDAIIIDTSPLLSVADTLELLPVADAIVLCVRGSKTTREKLQSAKSTLEHFTDQPSAIVVTGLRSPEEATYYGYYARDAATR